MRYKLPAKNEFLVSYTTGYLEYYAINSTRTDGINLYFPPDMWVRYFGMQRINLDNATIDNVPIKDYEGDINTDTIIHNSQKLDELNFYKGIENEVYVLVDDMDNTNGFRDWFKEFITGIHDGSWIQVLRV